MGWGGMYAVWSDERNGQIYALRVGSDGQRPPGWPANGLPVANQVGMAAQVAPDGLGGMYAVWDGSYDVFAQHLTGSGQVAPGWSASGTALAPGAQSSQEHVQIAGYGLGGAIVTWQDTRNYSTSTFDIYAQKLEADGPVPVAMALVSAQASPGRALLTWFAADRLARTATVYRHTASSDWLALATISSEGTGRLTYEDRAVESGGRYAYRLGYRDGTGEVFTAETWLDIPSGYRLALEGLRPNPAQGRLVVSFMLPSAEPATLELIDVTGRRVAGREVGSLGGGSHLLELGDGARVPAGLYWLRLMQGGRVLTARGVVAR